MSKKNKESEKSTKKLEDYVYGEFDYDFPTYNATGQMSSPYTIDSQGVNDVDVDWDFKSIIHAHGELEVGSLVKHNNKLGIVTKKLNIPLTDELLDKMDKFGFELSTNNTNVYDIFMSNWTFKIGYDNNLYEVAINKDNSRIKVIGWTLEEIKNES